MRRLALLLLALCLAPPAGAQTFPDRPLRLVIPYTPGGTNDIVGRLVTEGMAQRLGQSFVVENRGGAGGMIGSDVVAKSPPDGLTLLMAASGEVAINQHLYKDKMSYDPLR